MLILSSWLEFFKAFRALKIKVSILESKNGDSDYFGQMITAADIFINTVYACNIKYVI